MALSLAGKVALVAGATRGAGRGIAVQLGAAGATVYVTGRSTRCATIGNEPAGDDRRDRGAGGRGRRPRHRRSRSTTRVRPGAGAGRAHRAEQGALHILVNDIWGAEHLSSGTSRSGNTTSRTACAAAPRRRHPRDHQPFALPLLIRARRPGGRDDRRHRRLQRATTTGFVLLRPRQGGDPRMALALAHELAATARPPSR